jgi:3-dehydroquinate dehydratase-2
MTQQIVVLSGPNLDLLGQRDPAIYGTMTLEEHIARFCEIAETFGASVRHVQSNFEGNLVEEIHAARLSALAIVINAGALTHSSWSLRDALDTFDGIKIEVHLSNPAAREPFRHVSTLAGVVDGSIAGFGATSYDLAAYAVRDLLSARG